MSNSDLPRDPHIRAAMIVGSVGDGVHDVSEAFRQTLVTAVAEDLALAANQAAATDVRVDEVEVRVDTLETTTEALGVQADALVADITQRRATIDARLEGAAEQHTALVADIALRRATIDARVNELATRADDQAARRADSSRRRAAAIEVRLDKIERLAQAMGVAEDTTANESEPPALPSRNIIN